MVARSTAARRKSTAKPAKNAAPDVIRLFFEGLAERGHEPMLASASGTLRFEFTDGAHVERWYVTLHKGDITVSRRNLRADTVLRADKELGQRLVTGEANAMASMLRGLLEPEGDRELLVAFSRLFPGPPRAHADRSTAGYSKRMR